MNAWFKSDFHLTKLVNGEPFQNIVLNLTTSRAIGAALWAKLRMALLANDIQLLDKTQIRMHEVFESIKARGKGFQ